MKKTVIVINGNGGVGKDTLCKFASTNYKVTNISSIKPIKQIAFECGWNGKKDEKNRKFLSDLKMLLTQYNDLPYQYIINEFKKFLINDSEILFVHIRERNEIDRFKKYIKNEKIHCITLLIKRNSFHQSWGNEADDNVENYDYDYIYNNDKLFKEAKDDFINFLGNII